MMVCFQIGDYHNHFKAYRQQFSQTIGLDY